MMLAAAWLCVIVPAGYCLAFRLTRRSVTLRLGRLGWVLLVSSAASVGLLMLFEASNRLWTVPATAAAVSLGPLAFRRVWVFNVASDAFREAVEDGCARLFLRFASASSEFRAGDPKFDHEDLSFVTMGARLTLLRLPRRPSSGKTRLLVQWLSKQYPGPIPQIRIVLDGKQA